jgi:hypothetical protein
LEEAVAADVEALAMAAVEALVAMGNGGGSAAAGGGLGGGGGGGERSFARERRK